MKIAYIVTLSEGAAPTRIQLIPMGGFTTNDRRQLRLELTELAAEKIKAVFDSVKTDMVIDYEHRSFLAPGEPNPAAGWIKALSVESDGLWADVEWTQKAADMIAAKEYRYLSPSVGADENGMIGVLINAALTNMPAIDGMKPLSMGVQDTDQNNKEESIMLEKILMALGLAPDASEADILAKIASLADATAKPTEELLSQLGLKNGDNMQVVLASIKGLQAGSDQLTLLSRKIAEMETAQTAEKADKLITLAMSQGKVTPATKDNMLSWAKTDYSACEAFIKNAPAVVNMSQQVTTTQADADPVLLSAEMQAVADQIGMSVDDIKKYGGK